MREKISLRERFRRFMLRLFNGVPAEDYDKLQDQIRNSSLRRESLRRDRIYPIKAQTRKYYSEEEMLFHHEMLESLAREFLPVVMDSMWWKAEHDPRTAEFMVSAELWLYPLNEKENER